jgi:hypothetical protein
MKRTFNTIIYNINHKKFETYNVITYLVKCYKEEGDKPRTLDDFKLFVERHARYQWWSRCEYEIVLSDWPSQTESEKVDIFWQIMNNIDVVAELLQESVSD